MRWARHTAALGHPTGACSAHLRYALGPRNLERWVPDKLSEPLPHATTSRGPGGESSPHCKGNSRGSHSLGVQAQRLVSPRPYTGFKCLNSLEKDWAGTEKEAGGHRPGKAALPLWRCSTHLSGAHWRGDGGQEWSSDCTCLTASCRPTSPRAWKLSAGTGGERRPEPP